MESTKNNFAEYSRSSRYRIIADNLRSSDLSYSDDDHKSDSSIATRSSSSFSTSSDSEASSSSYDNYLIDNENEFSSNSVDERQIIGSDNREEHLDAVDGEDLSSENEISYDDDDEFSVNTQDDEESTVESSSETDNEDDEEEIIENANEPLYVGAPITVGESIISILKVAVRFKVTGILLSYILDLVSMHCIQPNNCATTVYKLKKFLTKINSPFIRHYYCTLCYSKLNEHFCQNCNNPDEISYFLEVPIIAQLAKFLKRADFRENLNYRYERIKENCQNYEDIFDGTIYNSLPDNFSVNKNNITFTWNTDGVPLFKSSKLSVWPFFLMVNELPYKLRVQKKNILLTGLWFGPEKPSPNLFMGVFVNELEELYQGVNFEIPNHEQSLRLRAMIISGTCDLCAKALFMNVKQYNSIYGCPNCKIRTKREQNVTVYPVEENLELRTSEESRSFAIEAHQTDNSIFGVKGPTVLDKIVYNYVESTAVDEMHNVFQGLVKRLLSFWFDADYRIHGFSLFPFVNIINSRIQSITFPSFVPRMPRKVTDYAYWKATELVIFLLVYSLPLLKGIMTAQYFEHHALLVYAITILNFSSVSEAMIDDAAKILKEYVIRFEDLYGLRYMTCNVHLLLHLSDNVRKFGPLWVMTCFPFENLNGILKSYVHGSRHPQLQICSTATLFLSLIEIQAKILRPGSPASKFCERVDKSGIIRYKTKNIKDDIYAIGAILKPRFIPRRILNALNNDYEEELFNLSKCEVFHRLLKQGKYYETELYIKRKKSNSTFVKYYYRGEKCFGILQYFITLHKCEYDDCNQNCNTFAVVMRCELESVFLCNFIESHVPNTYVCTKYAHDLRAIYVDAIIHICFYFKIENCWYVVIPTNLTEQVIA